MALNDARRLKTFVETFQEAGSRTVQSNLALEQRLLMGELRGWARSGDVVVYLEPHEEFESAVGFFDLRFEVPKLYRGLRDATLVLQSPDVKIEYTDGIYVVKGDVKHVVEEFPQYSGWYKTHEGTGLPQGRQMEDREIPTLVGYDCSYEYPDRQFSRLRSYGPGGNGFIGSAVRGQDEWSGWRDIYLLHGPDHELGVEYASGAATLLDDSKK